MYWYNKHTIEGKERETEFTFEIIEVSGKYYGVYVTHEGKLL